MKLCNHALISMLCLTVIIHSGAYNIYFQQCGNDDSLNIVHMQASHRTIAIN